MQKKRKTPEEAVMSTIALRRKGSSNIYYIFLLWLFEISFNFFLLFFVWIVFLN
jgi:hypothetical protein